MQALVKNSAQLATRLLFLNTIFEHYKEYDDETINDIHDSTNDPHSDGSGGK